LAAGLDYNGRLTSFIPTLGFGFESTGTVTHGAYNGNKKPRLGRLVKSRSLLVNKGFKSIGLDKVISGLTFTQGFPLGISIGATNSLLVSTPEAQIADIVKSFQKIKDDQRFSYFELNISCPNVRGAGTLGTPDRLVSVLNELQSLKLCRPLFIKFPVDVAWEEAQTLLAIMVEHGVAGVIIGNLTKDRKNSAFVSDEIKKAGKGNFSGKPTRALSNKLISKTYQEFGNKLIIIGVGGVFSAKDAYSKIKRGASLVQLVTGLIYQGPQLVAEINHDLVQLLRADGFNNITEAVGSYHRKSTQV
jgi:dihydroorotate dehydrogenase subfamily 2